jgi:hypothetical protein
VWGLAIEFWSGNLHFWRAGDLFDSIIASLLILQNYRYQKAIHTSGGLVSKDESPSSSSSYIQYWPFTSLGVDFAASKGVSGG